VVADLDEAKRLYTEILGLPEVYHEIVADQGVEIIGVAAGDVVIELLKPLSPESPIEIFRDGAPSKLHHIAYRVADITTELARLKTQGFRLIDESPRRGAHGNLIAFLHPNSTGRVLIELCQSGKTRG
jgi:methylmalonyl-CoA epimerase